MLSEIVVFEELIETTRISVSYLNHFRCIEYVVRFNRYISGRGFNKCHVRSLQVTCSTI